MLFPIDDITNNAPENFRVELFYSAILHHGLFEIFFLSVDMDFITSVRDCS